MAGIIKVNQYQDFNGNSIMTSDGSGNLTTQNIMKPAFFAHASSNTTISDATQTIMIFGTEVYDTNGVYDNSNGRFTVPTGFAGRYFIYAAGMLQCGGSNQFLDGQILLYKNGTVIHQARHDPLGDGLIYTLNLTFAIDLVASDYIEIKAYVDDNGGTPQYNGNASQYKSYFGAYRMGA